MMRALVLVVLLGAVAQADTLGYMRATPIEEEVILDTPKGAARVVVARNATEWRAVWKAAGGRGVAKAIDFDRSMIVGVINAAKQDRVVYRIQLDDAANAHALEVHLGFGSSPTWSGDTRKATRAQFVVTPRSALAVRFVTDEMVDGPMFAHTNTGEGVDSTEVATIAAIKPTSTDKAALREDAERLVVAQLSPTERTKLLAGPLGGQLARVPHGWTKLDVVREPTRWRIAYDDLAFSVDVKTGVVTRR